MVVPSLNSCLAAFTTGTAKGVPTSIRPSTNFMLSAVPVDTTPSRLDSSLIAPVGQTLVQPPQPWQISLKTRALSPNTARALKAQAFTHSPQPLQSSRSTAGTWIETSRSASKDGFRKKWAFGSSTSQSTNCTGASLASTWARLTATVVLPVPPLPLAIATLTLPLPT